MDSWVEQKLLKGDLWAVGSTTGSIAGGATVTYGLTTGNVPVMYMDRHYVSSVFNVLVELYEEGYTGGSPVTALNRNMTSGGTSPSNHFSGITRSGGGALKASLLLLGDATGSSSAHSSDGEYFILKPSTNYVLALTNNAGSAGFVNFRFTFRRADS